MTINIGLKYDKGALLLADGRVISGTEIVKENECKLYKICENASVAYAGDASGNNQISTLVYAAKICENYFKQLIKKKNTKKLPLLERADIRIVSFTKGIDEGPKNMTLEELLVDWSGEEIIPEETFRIYKSDLHKKQILLDIGSIGKQFGKFVTGETSGIIAGMDIKGPRIIQTYTDGFCDERAWTAQGAGGDIVKTYLEDNYKQTSNFNQALELAIFCGIKSALKELSVNQNFMAVNITTKNEKVVSELVPKKTIEEITKIYSKRTGIFKPLSK
jgi:20S proteasome alpha/beta subunit